MDLLPSAGGDITNIAFTTPGAVVNVTGGYGNFTVNGLPATSNLFTVNGENNMDPYFNINNSGATNLSLGQNELQEATVIANPYGGQYGQLSGAQVSYVTRSGTNEFHGNTLYWWNGRVMNSNNWFANSFNAPRPFSNANQWAARVGGPIFKNRTFFFVDTEGLRFVLPNTFRLTIPTRQFATAVVANVLTKRPAEAPAYQKMMNLWLNAQGSWAAEPLPNTAACSKLSVPGFRASQTVNCAAQYVTTATAQASQSMVAVRIDQKVSDKNNAFFRWRIDRGTQPTTIDPISANFNAISNQPAWDTQFNDTHILSANATNEFTAALSHYVALFSQGPAAAETFPTGVSTSGVVPFSGFNPISTFPQGRNITQYQIIDNLSWKVVQLSAKFTF